MPEAIRYCVTVDTEEEWDWNSGYPTGPTRTANIALLPLFQKWVSDSGNAVVYFTNHAVLADPESRAVIQQLAETPRVEIGLTSIRGTRPRWRRWKKYPREIVSSTICHGTNSARSSTRR